MGGQSRSGAEILDKIADLPPGTLFFNTTFDYHLIKMAPNESYHIGSWNVFNARTGTLHHISEFWLWGDETIGEEWTVVEPDPDDDN